MLRGVTWGFKLASMASDDVARFLMGPDEFGAISRAVAESYPVHPDGNCIYCRAPVGGVVERWQIDMGDFKPERLGKFHQDHPIDCLWRRAFGLDELRPSTKR